MKKWTSEQISNLNKKTAIITGASSGIGLEAAKVLAEKGADVIIAVRNPKKGESALKQIGRGAKQMQLDLSDLASVKTFAEEFSRMYSNLDLLINNAGVMVPPYSKTKDGFELQMGTNHFGHFALTGRLLPFLLKSKHSRVVNVSSAAHKGGKINFDDLNWESRKYSPWSAYGDSKIANLYFTAVLQKRFENSGSTCKCTAAHPGWTATELQRNSGMASFGNRLFAMKGWQGALPTLRAATDSSVQGGEYFGPHGFLEMRGYPVPVQGSKLAQDANIAENLWTVSESLTKVQFEF